MTIGELLDKLQACVNSHDARKLAIELRKDNPAEWWHNVKYVTGYLGNEERQRILALFQGE